MLNITDKTKNYIVFLSVFLFMFVLNCLTPVYFGDDIVYSYKWEDGMYLLKPLTNDNVLISSFSDLFVSMKNHYLNWHGRLVPTFLMFFWAWIGKDWFNIFNALLFVLLFYFIGRIVSCSSLYECNWKDYSFLFILIWIFMPGWVTVFLWQSGSVNYLWTIVLIFTFFIHYLQIDITDINPILMFILGLLSGCTNENNVPIIILICCYLIYNSVKRPLWSFTGIFGLVTGFFIFWLSPSFKNRIIADSIDKIPLVSKEYGEMLERVITGLNNGQFMPWLFEKTVYIENFVSIAIYLILVLPFITFLFIYRKNINNRNIKIFISMSFLSMACMMFSLYTPFRSLFFSFVYLLIAVIILYHQIETDKWFNMGMKYLVVFSVLYFTVTASLFTYVKYISWADYKIFDSYLSQNKNQSVVYELPRYPVWTTYLIKSFEYYNDFDFQWVKNSVLVKYNLTNLELIY